jgi:nicotinamidase-related amidase
MEKNSLSPAIDTRFDDWLDQQAQVSTFVVVGNCTDLCVYQLAMHLRMRANAFNLDGVQVIVPADAVDTYDLSDSEAAAAGVYPHPGEYYHRLFLHHMALNGIDVVASVTQDI